MDNDKFKLKGNIASTIDNTTLFWYITIFIIILYVFSLLQLNLNNILGFIIGIIIILYLYNDYIRHKTDEITLLNEKKSLIVPSLTYSIDNKDIVNFLFSIQDYYTYNPSAYDEMVSYIDYFFLIYNNVQYDNKSSSIYYNMLIDQKRNALNALQSILFNIPRNVDYDKKLNNAQYMLNIILNKYCKNIKDIYDLYLYENGYDNKMITLTSINGPVAKNIYDDTIHSYVYH